MGEVGGHAQQQQQRLRRDPAGGRGDGLTTVITAHAIRDTLRGAGERGGAAGA